MSAPVRLGVVGAGSLGYHHARIARDLPGLVFRGIFEANAERAGTVSRDLGIRAYPTLDALLDDVDAVSIVTPTPAHHAVAMRALALGKHLLIEKPITVTLEEADELLALAERQGVLVQIGHVERFNRAIRAAQPHVDRPLFIDSDRLAPFNPRGSDVAVVLDLMIHDIDLVLTLIGGGVRDVTAAPSTSPTRASPSIRGPSRRSPRAASRRSGCASSGSSSGTGISRSTSRRALASCIDCARTLICRRSSHRPSPSRRSSNGSRLKPPRESRCGWNSRASLRRCAAGHRSW
jgi:predicted dehydrogenase